MAYWLADPPTLRLATAQDCNGVVVRALGEREPARIFNAKGIPLLTKREEQVVGMVTDGLPSSEISKKLGVSAHTVKNHLFHIFNKLGVSNRAELLLYALSNRDASRGQGDLS
jgi:DNA-binding CsgD family transcriptional regulator